MTDTLRAKQNMEILDVWKDINSQVVGLQNKQIQQFPESLKAKTQRDLSAEVNVDKTVENINKLIDAKLGSLEFVVQNINPENRGTDADEELSKKEGRNTFYTFLGQVNNTGELIPLWNSIVRAYQEIGVNRETQQMIKVKVQELVPNLEAVVYGLNQAIDTIFGKKIVSVSFAGTILELLRTLSVYSEIQSQVESNPPRFEMLSVELLARAFKNAFESQSADRLQVLKQYAPRGLLTSATIRNIPDIQLRDINSRIRAIEEELGVKIPADKKDELYDLLSGVSGVDLKNAMNEIKSQLAPQKDTIDPRIKSYLNEALRLAQEWDSIVMAIRENSERRRLNEQEIEDLRTKEALSPEEIRAQLIPEPAEPIEPEVPELVDDDDYMNIVMFNDEYQQALSEWANAVLERERIIHHNASLQYQGLISSAQRQQRIDELEDENADLLEAWNELFNQFHQVEADSDALSELLNQTRSTQFIPMVDKILAKTKHKEMHDRNKEDARAKSAVMGYGRPVENRGLSTIKGGYGYNDTKQLNKQFMDFDDRKNDNYFTRPVV